MSVYGLQQIRGLLHCHMLMCPLVRPTTRPRHGSMSRQVGVLVKGKWIVLLCAVA